MFCLGDRLANPNLLFHGCRLRLSVKIMHEFWPAYCRMPPEELVPIDAMRTKHRRKAVEAVVAIFNQARELQKEVARFL